LDCDGTGDASITSYEHIVILQCSIQPGEGRVDFANVCKAIKDIGYNRYLVLETPATDKPEEAAARNLQY